METTGSPNFMIRKPSLATNYQFIGLSWEMETIKKSRQVVTRWTGSKGKKFKLVFVAGGVYFISNFFQVVQAFQVYSCYLRRYDIMLSCWEKCPDDRPTFEELFQILQEILNKNEVKFTLINGSPFC